MASNFLSQSHLEIFQHRWKISIIYLDLSTSTYIDHILTNPRLTMLSFSMLQLYAQHDKTKFN